MVKFTLTHIIIDEVGNPLSSNRKGGRYRLMNQGKEKQYNACVYQNHGVRHFLCHLFPKTRVPWLSEETPRDVVISACAAGDVPFSFVFCRDSYTLPCLDGPCMIPRGPDNEKKKTEEEKLGRQRAGTLLRRECSSCSTVEEDEARRREKRKKRTGRKNHHQASAPGC